MSKRTRRSRAYAPRYEWIGHIPVNFTDDERDHILAYVGERSWDFEDVISVLTQEGYGIKFTYDESRDCYYLSLQPKDKDNPYYGYTVGFSHTELLRLAQIASFVCNELIKNSGLTIPDKEKADSW